MELKGTRSGASLPGCKCHLCTYYVVIWSKRPASAGLNVSIYKLEIIVVPPSKMTVRIEITGKNSECLAIISTQCMFPLISITRTKTLS